MYRAFIFSMDGVLLDSEKVRIQLPRMLMEEMGISLPGGAEPCLGVDRVHQMLLQIIRQGVWKPGTEMNLDACVDWCHERMLSLYGSVVKPKAGALAFVRYLARTGISCCVLTAFKETMAKKLLADIEILPHVGLVDSVDDFSQESDWTECYARTAHKLVASPKDCVVVERALPAMRSAKAAGCTVWGIEESAQPDTVDAMRKVCNRYFSSFIQMQAHCMRIFA